jgi:hypothetical protein
MNNLAQNTSIMKFLNWLQEFYFRIEELKLEKYKITQKHELNIAKTLKKSKPKTVDSILSTSKLVNRNKKKSFFIKIKNWVRLIFLFYPL